VAFEKSAEHNLRVHKENKNGEHLKRDESTVELLDLLIERLFDVQSETETCTLLQKSLVMNMESNSDAMVKNNSEKKSHNRKQLDLQSKARMPFLINLQ
jgi:hypothetical protein